jgi:hypothetical protein
LERNDEKLKAVLQQFSAEIAKAFGPGSRRFTRLLRELPPCPDTVVFDLTLEIAPKLVAANVNVTTRRSSARQRQDREFIRFMATLGAKDTA